MAAALDRCDDPVDRADEVFADQVDLRVVAEQLLERVVDLARDDVRVGRLGRGAGCTPASGWPWGLRWGRGAGTGDKNERSRGYGGSGKWSPHRSGWSKVNAESGQSAGETLASVGSEYR